jgi:signal transduction histidine kinase
LVVYLFYARLIGLTAGTLVYLFLIALILGHRRPRLFERLLFFLVLALFAIYAGGLLEINAEIQYNWPVPQITRWFYQSISALGLLIILPLVWHTHYAYRSQIRGSPPTVFARPVLVALYLMAAAQAVVALFVPVPGSGIQLNASFLLARFVELGQETLPVTALLDAVFEFQDWRAARNRWERGLFRSLFLVSAILAALLIYKGPRLSPFLRQESLIATIIFVAIVPGVLLVYYALKHNFLEYGAQRNLVYALSATFLALLYLALVHRISGWLAPVFPPEATASVLLFVLIFLFEPLERVIGPVLHQRLRERMDRTQRLSVELQTEARLGDSARLVARAEELIKREFGLAAVRISIPRDPGLNGLEAPGGLGHTARIPLAKDGHEIGLLEAATTGAFLTGETTAALEFLAEQIPAMADLCRLIEEKLRLERELAEQERMAMLGQMAASVSHNLRNPLGSMKTILQVQLEKRSLPADVRHDCALVLDEINRMNAKLSQLLKFAKPAAASGERAEAVALAKKTLALFRHDAERRNVIVEFIEHDEEIAVLASEAALSEVLSNLVVNAIEAQPEGGRVRVSVARKGERLEICVEDRGPGISAEMRARIFQPFFTTKATGTGLGLAIVARRVEEMGGTLACESPVDGGTGSRFRVLLPMVTVKTEQPRLSEKL